jgi:hypothetical protein
VTGTDGPSSAVGSWQGTNDFRLMPTDDPYSAPASATVTAEPGKSVSMRYTWSHPKDGAQEGLLVVAPAEGGHLAALWLDTWHQPEARTSEAPAGPDGGALFEYVYAGVWGWQLEVLPGERLLIVMRNVVPDQGDDSFSGAYDAMRMTLERA